MQEKNNLTKSYSKGIAAIVISAFGFATMAFFVKQAGDVPVPVSYTHLTLPTN